MNKRFVVLLNPTTDAQNEAFRKYVDGSGKFAWWHWMNGSWLLICTDPNETHAAVQEQVMKAFPEVFHLVMDVTGANQNLWGGFGPKGAQDSNNMFKWLLEIWCKS